jgi:uncharacterized integral membrane protein
MLTINFCLDPLSSINIAYVEQRLEASRVSKSWGVLISILLLLLLCLLVQYFARKTLQADSPVTLEIQTGTNAVPDTERNVDTERDQA